MDLRIRMDSLDDLPSAARALLPLIQGGVWGVYGQMGAGKTTLVSALCNLWGVTDPVSSPTFSLVNVYEKADGSEVYHFDFYRINSEEEAMDMGVEEYFDSGSICLVEWPERVEGLLPKLAGTIHIEVVDGTRWMEVRGSENP